MSPGRIPEQFRRTVVATFPDGAAWLDTLPALISECEQRWHVSIAEEPFDLSYHFVAPAVMESGLDVVVKMGVPCRELRTEIEALQLYAGGAAVELLAADADKGMLLLERVRPAAKLSTIDDENATRAAARTMRELWRPLPQAHPFPTAADWALGFQRLRLRSGGGTGPFETQLVSTAESLFKELLGSSEPPVLVHGDLHHFNILSASRRPWLAIDPKGVAAEPAYEVGALLRNPGSDRYLDPAIQRRRISLLADELGISGRRIADWGAAQAVLSAWWTYEDGGTGWKSMIACAGTLLAIGGSCLS